MRINKLYTTAALVLASAAVFAQKPSSAQGQSSLAKDYPLVAERMFLNQPKIDVANAKVPHGTVIKAPAARLKHRESVLWGNTIYRSDWDTSQLPLGIYSFTPSNPNNISSVLQSVGLYSTGGGVYRKNHYYSVYLDMSMYEEMHTIGAYLSKYTLHDDGWTIDTLYQPLMGRFDMVALETAYLRSEDKVYGEFYTSDLKNYELGTIDYDNLTRTTIGSLSHAYVAMGITSDGRLYGVASDGNLYKIDTSTAKETLIGSTGVYLTSNTSSSYYAQSGEIDQKDNTFYWCALDRRHNATLYTVDQQTGKANRVQSFTNADQVLNLQIPEPEAADAAPGPVSELTVNISGVNTTAGIEFNVPDTTYAGDTLSGTLTYDITCNGKSVGTGNAEPGEDIYKDVTLPTQSDTIVVRVSNSEGASPAVSKIVWVGYDVPQAPDNIDLTTNPDGARISWNAPVKGTHNGIIGKDIKYNVYRYPGHTEVAKGVSGTSYNDSYTDPTHKAYYYTVTASAEGFTGPEGRSNSCSFAAAVEPPYNEEFINAAQVGNYTIYDENADGSTWYYSTDTRSMKYSANANNGADDWLITPAIYLKNGETYDFGLSYYEQYMMCEENFEIFLGKKASPNSMTTRISDVIKTNGYNTEKFNKQITVDDDGEYYIGIHALSTGQQGILVIDSLGIRPTLNVKAPGKSAITSVNYGNTEGHTATINFTLPETAVDGSNLSALTAANIYRNGIYFATIDNVAPGQQLSYTDNDVLSDGYNYYNVAAENENGIGELSDKGYAYVGNDVPKAPINVKAIDKQNAVELHWSLPKRGNHDGYVNASTTWYKIYSRGVRSLDLIDSIQGDTTITLPVNTDEDEQHVLRYAVLAQNEGGVSNLSDYAMLIAGKADATPYHESFEGGNTTKFIWVPATVDKNWSRTSVYSSDLEEGAAYVSPSSHAIGETQRISTGRISLSSTTAPQLMFSYLSIPGMKGTFDVKAITPDGNAHNLSHIDLTKLTKHGWQTVIADLSEFKNERYVLIDFGATFNDEDAFVYLDNINVGDLSKKDIAMNLQFPDTIAKGHPVKLLVNVVNNGTEDIDQFIVNLRTASEQIARDTVTTVLPAGARRQLSYDYAPSVVSEAKTISINASINCKGDANFANNIGGKVIALKDNDSKTPRDLTADSRGGAVSLSWTAPEADNDSILDDFESYDDWQTENIGDWTTLCADSGANRAFFTGNPCPNDGLQYAYEVFNVDTYEPGYDVTDHNSSLIPHSGKKYLCSNMITQGDKRIAHDDWLISPELSGGAQTIHLWVNNYTSDILGTGWPITIEVYESFGGKTISDFQRIDEPVTISHGQWQRIDVTLLEGTKYFALRNITPDSVSFLMLVDDASYVPASKRLEGYNIYADGKLVGSTKATSFVIAKAEEGEHNYNVTAVYGGGCESAPVSVNQATGIRSIASNETGNDKNTSVYTLSGIRLGTTTKGLPKGIYIVGGKKVVIGK